MRKALALIVGLVFVFSSQGRSLANLESPTIMHYDEPKWSVGIDFLNTFDIFFPTIPVTAEYQISDNLAIHQEFGYGLEPNSSSFSDPIKYDYNFGYKARTELKFYYYNENRRQEEFMSLGAFRQFISLEFKYFSSNFDLTFVPVNASQETTEGLLIYSYAFSIRFGAEYKLSKRLLLSPSIGVGRVIKRSNPSSTLLAYWEQQYDTLPLFLRTFDKTALKDNSTSGFQMNFKINVSYVLNFRQKSFTL